MFSIAHIVIIFVVALVVFGPEKLPELARTLGKVMGEFRRATGDLRSTFEGHMRDLEREADLRRVREAQNPAPHANPAGSVTTVPGSVQVTEGTENTIGGALMTALPVSTPEVSSSKTSDASAPSETFNDLTPPAGTVQSERPNAAAFAETVESSPQQLQFKAEPQFETASQTENQQQFQTEQLHAGERPDLESEKASDGRTRPA